MEEDKAKFFKRTGMFLAILIFIFILVNIAYNKLVLPQKHVNKSEEQFMQNNNNNLKILFLGDSHPAWAVNPSYIKNSFNYATPTETYEQTYYKLRSILSKDNKYQILVLPIDLHSFSDFKSDAYFNIWYWSRFMSINELQNVTSKSLARIYFNKYFPFIGNGNEFKLVFFKSQKSVVINGWYQREEIFASKNMTKDALEKARLHFKDGFEVKNERFFNFFIKILELSKSKDKKVIFIKYPISEHYKFAAESIGVDINEFYLSLNKSISKYSNVYVLDYQNYFTNYSLFSDSNHLNKLGAEFLSKKLDEYLRKFK